MGISLAAAWTAIAVNARIVRVHAVLMHVLAVITVPC